MSKSSLRRYPSGGAGLRRWICGGAGFRRITAFGGSGFRSIEVPSELVAGSGFRRDYAGGKQIGGVGVRRGALLNPSSKLVFFERGCWV